ncbi:MAG: glycosyltransferase family 39 protein [Verrucomicrobiota bacterium]
MSLEDSRTIRRDLVALMLFFGVLFFGTTWFRPLANPDEGRYSEIPREMLASGDWVQPRLNGVLYFYKPPLPYWLHALAIGAGGTSLGVLRFWPAAISLFGLLGTYLAARHIYGRLAGLFSSAILGTCLLYFGLSQIITLDPFVSVFMCLALFCYIIGLFTEVGRSRRLLFGGFYLLISLAVMSKGFMAIAIPGAIIFLWFVVMNQWRRLRDLYLGMGVLIFAVVAGPWHLAAWMQNPHWFDFYIIHEHWERYLSDVSDRSQPFWYYLVLLPIGFLPWTVFLPQVLVANFRRWSSRKEHPVAWFLLIWSAFVVFFFSLSESKLPTYILPVMAPLAVLTGAFLAEVVDGGGWKRLRRGIAALAGLLILLGLILPVLLIVRGDEVNPGGTGWVVLAIALLLAGGGVSLYSLKRGEELRALVAAFAGIALTYLCFNGLAARFQQPGTRAFAEFLKPQLEAGDQVFHFADYFQDFPFYLEQPVDLLLQFPNEQTFGARWEPEQLDRYVENQEEIPSAWEVPGRRFALAHAEHLPIFQQLYPDLAVFVWMADDNYVLFANQPMPK